MYYQAQLVGSYSMEMHGHTIYLSLLFQEHTLVSTMSHCIAYLVNHTIVRYHPQRFITTTSNLRLKQALAQNLFFSKGQQWIRPVEKIRHMMKDRVFDEEGYIIDQGAMQDIPFGWFDTASKGCGWIAAYNLLKRSGREVFLEEIVKEISDMSSLGNIFGVSLFAICRYCKAKGMPLKVIAGNNEKLAQYMQDNQMGILLYMHQDGGHYCTYEKRPDGRIRFLNAIYGRRNDFLTPYDFLENRTVLPCNKLLVLK